jgi:hypothetical protein
MDSCDDTPKGGLPHSDIHGSKPARGSPWLFAACHVLHRLLVPRHPPNALLILRSSGQRSVIHLQEKTIGLQGKPWSSGRSTPTATADLSHLLAQNPDFRRSLRRADVDPDQFTHAPLNPRCPTWGAFRAVCTTRTLSRSDISRTTGRTRNNAPLPSHAPRDAPEPDSP